MEEVNLRKLLESEIPYYMMDSAISKIYKHFIEKIDVYKFLNNIITKDLYPMGLDTEFCLVIDEIKEFIKNKLGMEIEDD